MICVPTVENSSGVWRKQAWPCWTGSCQDSKGRAVAPGEYIYETAAIAINFFSRAGDMEAELESSEALKFREAVNGMKESIRDLIR